MFCGGGCGRAINSIARAQCTGAGIRQRGYKNGQTATDLALKIVEIRISSAVDIHEKIVYNQSFRYLKGGSEAICID